MGNSLVEVSRGEQGQVGCVRSLKAIGEVGEDFLPP